MTAALIALLGAVWDAAGSYILSALAGAAAVVFVWIKHRNTRAGNAKKDQAEAKKGEETAALVNEQLGVAAQTIATIESAKRGVNAQSDDSVRTMARTKWMRK